MSTRLQANIMGGRYAERTYLTWFVDGDEGGSIGDDPEHGTGPEPADREDWETWIAAKLAREQSDGRDLHGYHWESHAKAQTCLRQIKLAWKNRTTPLPDWAKRAIAAGWKAPRGWRP